VLKLRRGVQRRRGLPACAIEAPEAERVARLVGAEGGVHAGGAGDLGDPRRRRGRAGLRARGGEPEVAAFAEAEPAEPDESLTTPAGSPRPVRSRPCAPDLPDAPAASWTPPTRSRRGAAPRFGDEEIELDLDEVFVLDMESEEEPRA